MYIYKQLSFLEEVNPKDLILNCSNDNTKVNEKQNLIDEELYEQFLKACVLTNSVNLKINVYTVQKPYAEWNLSTVCNIFKLPAHYKDLPKFTCGTDDLNDSKSKKMLSHHLEDLKLH